MHRNNHDCDHGLADDSRDVVASSVLVAMIHDCLADESMPVSTEMDSMEVAKYFVSRQLICKSIDTIKYLEYVRLYLLASIHPMNRNHIHFLTCFLTI